MNKYALVMARVVSTSNALLDKSFFPVITSTASVRLVLDRCVNWMSDCIG